MVLEKVLGKFNQEVFLWILLAVFGFYWLLSRNKYRIPPGPWGIPILGYLPFLSRQPFKKFYELSKTHGSTFSLYLGRSLVVILNDFKSVKEAFNHSDILDRPPKFFEFYPDGLGFISHNGEEWVEQRRYTMKSMRDIGLGKSSWDSLMEAEVGDLIKFLEENSGKPVNILNQLSASVSNNMTSLVFGQRLLSGDKRRETIDKGIEALIEIGDQASFVAVFPTLFEIMLKLGFSNLAEHRKRITAFNSYLRKEAENRKNMLEHGSSEVFFDEYLTEIKKRKNEKTFFNEKNLLGNAQALIIAGSETTRTSLLWMLLGMAANPEVQKKVQEEIDLVLGKEGKCTWMERSKLPYTYATIIEAQRWRTVAPLGVLHSTSADAKISEFEIPKGTHVMVNAWAIHNDPKNWHEPEKYIPERFLNKDGSLIMQKPENYVPFSIGRRSCPGEFIAMIEIFHYFTSIMQKFKVQVPVPGQMPDLEGTMGGTYSPKPQKLVFTLRDSTK